MAKTSLERTLEKQQHDNKRIAEQEARRQRAEAIVNGQPFVGGMRLMDAASEEVFKAIIETYDGNECRMVKGDNDIIPVAYHNSLNLEFEKLKMYGVISYASVWINGMWEATLTPQGISYFESKNTAMEKEEKDTINAIRTNAKEYDVFISHANKDKSEYVDDLFLALRKLGIKIFYDSDILSWGDNWKQIILDGTEKSEFAIIVISENFFGREWTERELEEFLNRQNANGQKIVLPLLHNVTIDKLVEIYPYLGDIQMISTDKYSKEEITILFAKELIKRLR